MSSCYDKPQEIKEAQDLLIGGADQPLKYTPDLLEIIPHKDANPQQALDSAFSFVSMQPLVHHADKRVANLAKDYLNLCCISGEKMDEAKQMKEKLDWSLSVQKGLLESQERTALLIQELTKDRDRLAAELKDAKELSDTYHDDWVAAADDCSSVIALVGAVVSEDSNKCTTEAVTAYVEKERKKKEDLINMIKKFLGAITITLSGEEGARAEVASCNGVRMYELTVEAHKVLERAK